MRVKLERITIVALVVAAFLSTPTSAQFNCIPTCADDDGRFLVIAAGDDFATLSDPILDLTFVVPGGVATFDLGVFDGDVLGSDSLGAFHWDNGVLPTNAVFEYTLFADPNANVSGTEVVLGPLSTLDEVAPGVPLLPNNDWANFSVATGPEAQSSDGSYAYRLRIELLNPEDTTALNAFKVRTSEFASIEPIAQPFGYMANITSFDDILVVFPSFPATTPTTYDGSFSFFVEAEGPQSLISVWDGDFDRGKFDGTDQDTDDPNTPLPPFEPTWATIDTDPEGVAIGLAGTTANPNDDIDPAAFGGLGGFFLRPPSVEYTINTPDSQSFFNGDPSGNREWEVFSISTTPGDPDADFTTATLPAGTYEVAIDGVDMGNLNFLLTPFRLLCVDEVGGSCVPPPSAPFVVGDTVFEDLDGDGVQDPGEPGLAGVVVNLLGGAGNIINTALTDANGMYSFPVVPGTYSVDVAPENFAAPAAGATLGDRVWLDDGDGIDSGEPGISNVMLRLFLDGGDGLTDGVDDTVVSATTTDQTGAYLFQGLAAGTYWVDVVDFTVPKGLAVVTAAGASDPSTTRALGPSDVVLDVDFPYANGDPATAVVGNYVWIDADGDGLQDVGEAGLADVTLKLIEVGGDGALGGGDDTEVAEARTATDGSYLFSGVDPGNYVVDVTDTAGILAASGLVPTTVGAGAPDMDSDPDPTAPFAVAAGDQIVDKDFGYVNMALADLSDTVWFDADRDGVFDGSETPLAGVTVNLVNARGEVIATSITDGAGEFTFADLPDGDYGIVISDLGGVLAGLVPTTTASARNVQAVTLAGADVFGVNFGWVDSGALEGYAGTTDDGDGDVDRHTDTVVDADVLVYDFGYRGSGSIGDRVWLDLNGDGVQDGGEPGINNVTVKLLDSGGVQISTMMTAGDGAYLFEGLVAGTYTVEIDLSTLPPSLAQTFDLDGLLTPNRATVVLAAGEDNLNVDFGYGMCGPCMGKASQLTLAYIGALASADIEVFGKRGPDVDLLFSGTVMPGDELELVGPAGGTPGFEGTLGTEIRIFVDGAIHTVIHTSCSIPLFPGLVSGDFQVVAGGSKDGGLFCPLENPPGGGSGACLGGLDFETDAMGGLLSAGQIIDDEFAGTGVHVTTHDPVNHPAMIFDSANPTGGDIDLGSPNQDFGGPGVGSGGGAGQPGQNSAPLGQILIISEDGNSANPDDNAGGGTIIFDFDFPVRVEEVVILDIDEGMGGDIVAYDGGGSMIGMGIMSSVLGDNSVQTVAVGADGVRSLEVFFPGSGAVAGIVFCPEETECTPKRVRDDFDGVSFSNNDGPDNWSGAWIEVDPEAGGAGPSAGQVRIAGGYVRLDDYPNTGGHPSVAREVDLSGATTATLRFDFDTSSGVDYDDAVTVEISSDGGANYSTLEVITGITGTTWQARSFDITAFASSETRVRFRVSNKYGGSNEYFFMNFVEIESSCGDCREKEIADNFEVTSYSNNDGSDPWAGDWIEVDPEGGGPFSGQVRVHNGFLTLDDYPNSGTEPSAAREFDILGAETATVSFDFLTSSGVDTNDAVTVEVSSDGGANWSTLEVITGIYGWSSGSRTFDITAFASSQTQVRFRVSRYYGGSNEIFCVTFVKIETTCPVGPEEFTLSVSKSGTGSGTVTSAPGAIDCGATCSDDYTDGTVVVLTATADAGSTFAGWSGDCAGAASPTMVTVDANKSCNAQFDLLPPEEFTLSVTKSGTGTGTVTSAPGAINCGATCMDDYTDGTVVTLTPTPDAGSTFVAWSGDPDCTDGSVTMDAAKTCDAQFDMEAVTCPCADPNNWADSTWADFVNGMTPADGGCTLGPPTTTGVFFGGAVSLSVTIDGASSSCQIGEGFDPPVISETLPVTEAEAIACEALLVTNTCP